MSVHGQSGVRYGPARATDELPCFWLPPGAMSSSNSRLLFSLGHELHRFLRPKFDPFAGLAVLDGESAA